MSYNLHLKNKSNLQHNKCAVSKTVQECIKSDQVVLRYGSKWTDIVSLRVIDSMKFDGNNDTQIIF